MKTKSDLLEAIQEKVGLLTNENLKKIILMIDAMTADTSKKDKLIEKIVVKDLKILGLVGTSISEDEKYQAFLASLESVKEKVANADMLQISAGKGHVIFLGRTGDWKRISIPLDAFTEKELKQIADELIKYHDSMI